MADNIPILNPPADSASVLANSDIPKIYTNGFNFGNTFTDASIIFQLAQVPLVVITMEFTTLKSLHNSLTVMIEQVEKGLGQPLLDIREKSIQWEKNIHESEKK